MVLSLQFTAFDIQYHSTNCPGCSCSHLTIMDGDGTTLMERGCGSTSEGTIVIGGQSMGSTLPANITSRSNIVMLSFVTSGWNARPGWSLSWTAVAPGECRIFQENVLYSLFLKFSLLLIHPWSPFSWTAIRIRGLKTAATYVHDRGQMIENPRGPRRGQIILHCHALKIKYSDFFLDFLAFVILSSFQLQNMVRRMMTIYVFLIVLSTVNNLFVGVLDF